jgi:DNA-binding CsgD family transcriptional regulator
VLTVREFDAVRMRRAGYSVLAIAHTLGCGEGAVRSALRRAAERLGV